MRTGIAFTVSTGERQRLRAIVADPKSPQKRVWRARIVLLSADGLGTSAIMAETGKSKTCVWRWQERFMHEGVDGLLRDRSRPPGKAPVPPERVAEIDPRPLNWSILKYVFWQSGGPNAEETPQARGDCSQAAPG